MSTRKNRGEYAGATLATLADLGRCLDTARPPVVLLEGTRALPLAEEECLAALGAILARRFPEAVFRTGNAEGSDSAFARGVASVDAARIEYILPRPGMGRRRKHAGSRSMDLNALPISAETRLEQFTVGASPDAARLVRHYRADGVRSRNAARATYLLRDTLKVAGAKEVGLAPAAAGLFYVNPADPLAGGTGHTIRVCNTLAVPVAFQHTWLGWMDGESGTKG